jgi:type I restriction enzyme S subunit
MKIRDIAVPNDDNSVNPAWDFINYLDTSNCTKNEISIIQKISKGNYPSRAKRVVKKDDIIISTVRPNQCHYAIIKSPLQNMVVSTGFTVLSSTDAVVPEFLYYFLSQERITEKLNTIAAGATTSYPSINPDDILDLEINLPGKDNQVKIANVLTPLDNKISLNNRINAELEQMARTIYNYWFVQFDFPIPAAEAASMGKPELEGKPYKASGGEMVWNEELKREIPVGWEVKKLGNVLDTVLGGTPSTSNDQFWKNGTYHWLNSGEIANFPVVESELKITEEAIRNSATELLPKGTTLLSITRHLRPTILAVDACANQSVVGIKENGDIKCYFLYPYLKNEITRLTSLRTGAQQPHINKDILDNSIIILPPSNDDILNKYNEISEPIFKQIIANAFQSQELTRLRDFLLPLLMNGQVRVDH